MPTVAVEYAGKWTEPEFLEAALNDLSDMLEAAVSDKRKPPQTQIYMWTFRQPRGQYVSLEITARRLS